jgi:hypothetical protein
MPPTLMLPTPTHAGVDEPVGQNTDTLPHGSVVG